MSTGWMDQIFDSSTDKAGPKHYAGAPALPSPAGSPTGPTASGSSTHKPGDQLVAPVGPEVTATGRRWSKRSTHESSPGPAGSSAAPAPPSLDDQPVPVRGYRSSSERAIFEVAEQFCPHDQLVVCLYHASGKRKGKVYKAVPWNEYFEVMREIEAKANH